MTHAPVAQWTEHPVTNRTAGGSTPSGRSTPRQDDAGGLAVSATFATRSAADYRALHDIPYTVYRGYRRTSTYIDDMARTLANIAGNFKPGEVYNIGGTDYHDIETCSKIVLKHLRKSDNKLVDYRDSEILTTRHKLVDCSKAARDLKHTSTVSLDEGIRRTLLWMKDAYKNSVVALNKERDLQ